ncbi:hypothetical protein MAP00_001746 [Monascus purpureus]|nr:hypothetical protein MAP00_001746 [Monascus purpureus]
MGARAPGILNPDHGKLACVPPISGNKLPESLAMDEDPAPADECVGCASPMLEGGRAGDPAFGFVYFRYPARGLTEVWFSGHPYRVREDGLHGVEGVLGQRSEVCVLWIEDTPASTNP